jgi:hypothetical protein
MNLISGLRRYAAHPDPATAAANLVALVVAGNGPFYPLYVVALIGDVHVGLWLTMLASPFFFAVPAISRRDSCAGRAALPLIGTVNTIWCAALLGGASEVGLFLLPCATLAALLFRSNERPLALLLVGLAVAALILLIELSPVGLLGLGLDQMAVLARLNTISVATLTGFLALTLASVFRECGAASTIRERSQKGGGMKSEKKKAISRNRSAIG